MSRTAKNRRTEPARELTAQPPGRSEDPELHRVADALRALDPAGAAFGEVLRDTYDQLLDGQRTGRFSTSELMKTEKTHMGTLVEINLQRRFMFADGSRMDYEIAGCDVDCKFSQDLRGWEIPPQAYDPAGRYPAEPKTPVPQSAIDSYDAYGTNAPHLCLVVWASDDHSRWEAGISRPVYGSLNKRLDGSLIRNQDLKVKLSLEGESRILWLWDRPTLPENLLLQLDPALRSEIFLARTGRRKSGQARVNMLFRRVPGRLIRRTTILTVARQEDAPKRARDARLPRHLGKEGFLVLGHQEDDPSIARSLGLPVPSKGQWVSARVVPADAAFAGSVAVIGGSRWRIAVPGDPTTPAPRVSRATDRR